MARALPIERVPEFVGTELGVSDWILVDQPMVDAFAQLTDDHQWVHVDVQRAAREIGGTFAHGLLTLSLLPRMIADIVEVTGVGHALNYGFDRVRFLNKVVTGSRIRGRQNLISANARGDGLLMKSEVVVEVEGQDRPACVAEAMTLYFPG